MCNLKPFVRYLDYFWAIVVMLCVTAKAQPFTPSELGWPHPIPQLGNTNPPPSCPDFAQPASLVVVTDTVTSVTLPGGNGIFAITVNPSLGTLSGLNVNSGTVNYTAGNSTGADTFTYCVSNSPSCMTCAVVNVAITNLAGVVCGDCYHTPPNNGGIVTGNIFFNTGVPYESVCIDYSNATCTGLATNCGTTDANGNVQFFVHMCSGSSNYCIVSLGTCSGVPFKIAGQATVSGVTYSGSYNVNGTYYYNSAEPLCSLSFPQYQMTNSMSQGTCETLLWVFPKSDGGLLGYPEPVYALLTDNNFGASSYGVVTCYATNLTDFISYQTLSGWQYNNQGGCPGILTVPTTSTLNNLTLTNCCTSTCP